MPASIEHRRWTRLNPEILTSCRVRIQGSRLMPELRDLSPGGIGLTLPALSTLPRGDSILVRVAFRGQPAVLREGLVRGFDPVSGALGLSWPCEPSGWSGMERRSRARVHLPQDSLFGRLPLRHAHRVWSRLRIVDISSDLGFQVETIGGPGYLIPGHHAPFHLDIPLLVGRSWECQILWFRPGSGQNVRMGLRILDPDPDLASALGEWLELDRLRPPLGLQDLGFRASPMAGQFRFRKVEEVGERAEVDRLLERPETGDGERFGVWDGQLLVGAALMDREKDDTRRTFRFRLRREWVVPDVFLGLWEQVIRHFLTSGAQELLATSPPGTEALFSLAGLHLAESGDATKWRLTRRGVIWGRGMNLVRWHILYAEVGAFALQHKDAKPLWVDRLVRLSKLAAWTVLRDWREPVERGRLRRAIQLWSTTLEG